MRGRAPPSNDSAGRDTNRPAAAGVAPAALQAIAGHADMSTTQRYIDLAGITFREEVERAEMRMFGAAQA